MRTSGRADVHVAYHQMVVQEQGDAHAPGRALNGLVTSAPGAGRIFTGIHTGVVDVTVRLTDAPPGPAADGWEETEQVELVSFTGEMRLAGLMGDAPEELPVLTAHGPGRYGLRVHARGRGIDYDGTADVPFEFYLLTVWPIDVGPEARARLGVGVAEELGLPDRSREIREWAQRHAVLHEPGRPARQERPLLPPVPVRGVAQTVGHRLRIVNPYQDTAPAPDLPSGLVAAAPDSVVVRTLKERGRVGVHLRWEPAAPRLAVMGWEETAEIEFVTTTGVMRLPGLWPDDDRPADLTYQGAGRYGLRVHGRAQRGERLSNRPGESYLLIVWPVALGAAAALG
ncbi:hypothetical protein ACIBP6_43955 [Nonomuraea terrae]|uniref:hypothetical protein n=1 Tax=Nonomuraea terrae TaxID=2530383 RepID=UPI003798326D